jgi:hypothetical protein
MVLLVWIRTITQQQLNDNLISLQRCIMQSRIPLIIPNIRITATLQQTLHYLPVPTLHRLVQRTFAQPSSNVGVSTFG